MDFVHDALADGRAFRVLTVVDQWSRWSPILEVAQSMSGRAVAEALDRAIAEHGKPRSITVDHGTEFTSRVLDEWAYQRVFCSTSSDPESLSKTALSNPSTASCAMNV